MHRPLSSFCSITIFLGAGNFNGIDKQIDLNGGKITPTLQLLERLKNFFRPKVIFYLKVFNISPVSVNGYRGQRA